jgi:polyisoprenoid-binding protein YceI
MFSVGASLEGQVYPNPMRRSSTLKSDARANLRVWLCVAIVSVFAPPLIAGALPQAKSNAAVQLEVGSGTQVSYRVREQLAGLKFPTDAIGTTESVTGTIVIKPDGSIDSAKSHLTIDLRTLKSDQDLRDGYVKTRTLETDKFPSAEFVPKKMDGIPAPLPAPERPDQTSFQMVGDLTVHGVTKEVTLEGYATYSRDLVSGRASTNFTFATFGLTKPTLARLLSVDDNIKLEIEFRLKRN